ncbi:MAG TPA: PAS domain-containing sensor histidine kinase [Clostridia bacterium]|nr:PAS domain-containing sensor histidine kinase [Clostridia bacterium]
MDTDNNACILVSNGVIAEISDSFTVLTGYKAADLLGCPITEVFGKMLKTFVNYGIPDGAIEEETIIFTAKLEARRVVLNSSDIEDKGKRVYTFTEKPLSGLESTFSYFEQVINYNLQSIAIYACCSDTILLNASSKYLYIMPEPFRDKGSSAGRSIKDILEGLFDYEGEPIWNKVFTSGKPYEYREIGFRKPGKGIVPTNGYFAPIHENGKIKYLVHHITDVGSRDVERKNSNVDVEAILENMTEAILIVDREGKFIEMNAQMRKQQAIKEKPSRLGDNFDSTTYLDMEGNKVDADDLPAMQALRGMTVRNNRMMIKMPNKNITVEINACPILDYDGNVKGAVLCSRDITQLVESEKMKDEFLSIISHEFKTPITVILSITQAIELLCKDEMSVKLKSYIKQIRQNSFRQLRLVNNLLDVTRANAGRIVLNIKKHNLVLHTRLIVDSVQEFARQKGINLTFKDQKKEIITGIDDEKYERILLNLLSNAIKFTPKGKCVTVELTVKEEYISLSVIDEGIGIPDRMKDIIFERFGQVDSPLSRQAEGSGIGLSLVKMLVEMMNGKVSLSSTEGMGSVFSVLIPFVEAEDTDYSAATECMHDDRLIKAISVEFSDIYL